MPWRRLMSHLPPDTRECLDVVGREIVVGEAAKLLQFTCGGIPSSRKSGPRMKPPPRPSSPPTMPATIPQQQYRKIMWSFQVVISFPLDAITRCPLYRHIASYNVTEAAIGTCTMNNSPPCHNSDRLRLRTWPEQLRIIGVYEL